MYCHFYSKGPTSIRHNAFLGRDKPYKKNENAPAKQKFYLNFSMVWQNICYTKTWNNSFEISLVLEGLEILYQISINIDITFVLVYGQSMSMSSSSSTRCLLNNEQINYSVVTPKKHIRSRFISQFLTKSVYLAQSHIITTITCFT